METFLDTDGNEQCLRRSAFNFTLNQSYLTRLKKNLEQINLHDGLPQKVIPRFFENESKEKEYVLKN